MNGSVERQAAIDIDLGAGEIKLISVETDERLSETFLIVAEVVTQKEIDLVPNVGKPARFDIFESSRLVRHFHGLLAEIDHVMEDGAGFHYRLVFRPWTYFLQFNRAYRIFEAKSAVDIIKEVLSAHGVRTDYSRLRATYRPRPYCMQYQESDLQFLSRIMEQDGIYYFFRHEAGDHVLVLCDSRAAHQPAPGYTALRFPRAMLGEAGSPEMIWDWHEHYVASAERDIVLQAHDPASARVLDATSTGAARNKAETAEVHAHVGGFDQASLGTHWAKVRLEATQAARHRFRGRGDALGIGCGNLLKLSDDTGRRGVNAEFLLTAVRHHIPVEPLRSGATQPARSVEIEAVLASTPYRAPQRTAKPVAAGPETAIVVEGGADDSNADPQGRVRVEFHWAARSKARAPRRSCWLRVSHPSAGADFGHFVLPRNRQEVVVSFLEGDPDRPLITGRVYNGDHRHPYGLPEKRTRSVWRSRTIGRAGSYAGAEKQPSGPAFNELSFEDKGGAEEVYLRAQRDRRTEVMLDDDLTVQRDRSARIGRDRKTAVRGDDQLTVERGDMRVTAQRGSVVIEATRKLVLKVGMNAIVIDKAGISIAGMTVTSIGVTSNMMLGAKAEVQGAVMARLTGAVALLTPGPGAGVQAAQQIAKGMASAQLAAGGPLPGIKP
ncbi:type VI secretion system Vgr family protein [Sphingomonas zeicaulis]|uniref:type VI secretion system Vgr family protein n=1 Tax=Sphingomonas zeicaulis TaxID=1632740 RepID=UPI003D1AE4C6